MSKIILNPQSLDDMIGLGFLNEDPLHQILEDCKNAGFKVTHEFVTATLARMDEKNTSYMDYMGSTEVLFMK